MSKITKTIQNNKLKRINTKIVASKPRILSDKRLCTKPHQPNLDQIQALQSIASRSCTCEELECTLKCDCIKLTEINDRKSDNLIKLNINISNTLLEALVDSGASYNYLSKAAYEKLLPLTDNSVFTPSNHTVQIADKSIVKSIGRLEVDMALDEHLFKTTFTVLENLSFDVILGMSFLQKNKVLIDGEEGVIHFKDNESNNSIRLVENTVIPAHSQIVASVKANEVFSRFNFIQNNPDLVNKHGIHLAQGLVESTTETFQIFLCNLTNKSQTISADTVVGNCILLNEDEYDLDSLHVLKDSSIDPLTKPTISPENKLNFAQQIQSTLMQNFTDIEIDHNKDNFTAEQNDKIKCLINDYKDIFSDKNPGATNLVTHEIILDSCKPQNQMPNRVSPAER